MLEGVIDPFDLLQEHDLMINRLVKAVQSQEKVISNLVRQNQTMSQWIEVTTQKLVDLEKRLNQI